MAAARAVKDGARHNDLLERLASDSTFPVGADDLRNAVDAHRFVGRSAEQVDEFLTAVVAPVLAADDGEPGATVAPTGVRV